MIDLGNRVVLDDGTVICTSDAIMEMLYSGREIDGVLCDRVEDQTEWERASRACDSVWKGPVHAQGPCYHGVDWYQHWLTPEPYASINLRKWCMDRCNNDGEIERANLEIDEFESRGMISIMRHLIYCVDTWRKNGVVWGVGRGSSVCSFVLHLIGINRINPIEHGLDMGEWLK